MATKKATASRKSTTSRSEGSTGTRTRRRSGEDRHSSERKRQSPVEVAKQAARQLVQLTGREPEGVTGLTRTDEGWRVEIEVTETHRFPDTTDVLAVYEVDVDTRGNLVGYSRGRRYLRGRQDGEGQ